MEISADGICKRCNKMLVAKRKYHELKRKWGGVEKVMSGPRW